MINFFGSSVRPTLTPEFHTQAGVRDPYTPDCPTSYFPEGAISNDDVRPGCDSLPDNPLEGYARRRLLAASNDAYLINDIVDGIVAPFYATQTIPDDIGYICPGTFPPQVFRPYSYDSGVYRAMLESTKEQLGHAKLMALHLGVDQFENSLDLLNLEDQIEIAASVADYTGLWDMPLGVRFLSDKIGIFSDRRNDVGAADFCYCPVDKSLPYYGTTWNFLGYWPGRQQGVPGWYVRWHLEAGEGGTFVVKFFDDINPTNDPAAASKGLVQSAGVEDLSTGLSTTLFSYDLATVVSDAERTKVITLGPFQSLWLSLEQDVNQQVPSSAASAYFYVEDEFGNPIGADSLIWSFESGVEPKVSETYEVEKNVFLRLSKSAP